MGNFLKRVLKRFLPFKSRIFSHQVVSGIAELSELYETAFIHKDLSSAIHKDIIILIVSNDFVAEPGLMLTHFNRYYEFTIDEFVVLSYRIGMIVKMYIENPIYLLEDAIELVDVFEEDSINQFKKLLEKQIVHDRTVVQQKYTEFFNQITDSKVKINTIDIDANKKIDEWRSKNKKK